MKLIYRYIAIAAILITYTFQANGQTYHSWDSTIGDMSYSDGYTHIIILDKNVSITGTITVSNATTLRILNTSENILTISNGDPDRRNTPMFKIIGNAKLAFNFNDLDSEDKVPGYDGSRYRRIILDGGAGFKDMDRTSDPDGVWRLTAQKDPKFTVSAIQSIGALEIYNTTISNFYIPEDAGSGHGVIGLATDDMAGYFTSGAVNNYRYTILKNCIIEKCKGVTGTVIMIGDGNSFLASGIDPNSTDPYGNYRYVTLEDVSIRDCVTFCDDSGWGGLIRCRGGSRHSMKLVNSTFTGNFSHGDGAVLWWNACGHINTNCTIDGCTFINNRAMREAGAIRMEGSLNFIGNKTTISKNECLGKQRNKVVSPNTYTTSSTHHGNGGGIQIYGYAGGAGLGVTELTYGLPDCLEVTENYAAGYGGGIAFDFTSQTTLTEGSTMNAYFEGVIIKGNKAGKGGGGLLFRDATGKNYIFNLFLNTGLIENNTAPSGGGIYVQNINVGSQDGNTLSISKNIASAGCGGGIYIENGDITLNSVSITDNEAHKADNSDVYGGGGLFVKAGSFTINSGSISENHTDHYGGGVLVYNNASEQQTITLTNGLISQNSGLYGGGIASYGAISLNVNNINLESNVAHNGGGVFAFGQGADYYTILNYKSGIIRYNRAQSHEESPLSTVYDLDYKDYSGIGGGIYMGRYSYLEFENPAAFGIYENVADNGADDIFGYNNNVDIKLPNVANLKLDGYSTANTHELFWAEDYITNDTYYDKGTQIKSSWDNDKTNKRYRNSEEDERYLIDFGTQSVIHYPIVNGSSTYLSLTLGWTVSTLTLVKHGMNDGDNAIFKLYKVDGTETEYMTVILTDRDKQADGSRVKQITLSSDGVWKVVETDWSWTYTPANASIQKTLTTNSTDEERTFTFTNSHDNGTTITDEAVMINEMTNQ